MSTGGGAATSSGCSASERRSMPDRVDRVAWQHVVGEFVAESLGDRRDGRPLAVASNRVRELVAEATDVLPDDDAALARGLVIGDDTDQPPDMLERFRASGLAHLTAVSGQNVNFVMAAAGPLLRRLRPMPRLAASVALIGWFVVVTRAEPSVLRAGAMAALGTVAFAFGREREPAAPAGRRRHRSAAARPAARVIGRVLVVGRGHRRRDRAGVATGPPAQGLWAARRAACSHARSPTRRRGAEPPRVRAVVAGGRGGQPHRRADRGLRDAVRASGVPRRGRAAVRRPGAHGARSASASRRSTRSRGWRREPNRRSRWPWCRGS